MNFKELAKDVVQKSKEQKPICKLCGGKMQLCSFTDKSETWVCSNVKALNQQGDTRRFDPKHYTDSMRTKAPGVDFDTLESELEKAFVSMDKQIRDENAKSAKEKAEKGGKKKDKEKGEGEKQLLTDDKKPEATEAK